MHFLRLLAMLLLGCACQENYPQQYLDQSPPEEPPSYRPLWLIVKSYLAVMIIIVAVIIILFMLQSFLMKYLDSLGRCCRRGMANVRKRLIRKDEEEGNEQRDVSDNECINEQRFCKVSTLRMIDDVTPRLSFSDRPSEYQTFGPAPTAAFALAETLDSEFSSELIQSIKNRHGEPTP
ncbi:hypothetical protein PRIPAC_87004, partial [Pristionchus pacificus]|uniref:Uncharacterized protein n=1 Tax=Pristionchus pacificus TaxID=54126 RepID=A0A2A6BKA2_PRIPA